MKKIIDYCVVETYRKSSLVIEVNNLIIAGWQPLGGVDTSSSPKINNGYSYPERGDLVTYYCQAMVKYES